VDASIAELGFVPANSLFLQFKAFGNNFAIGFPDQNLPRGHARFMTAIKFGGVAIVVNGNSALWFRKTFFMSVNAASPNVASQSASFCGKI
jgi:hypothetical protein